MDTGNRFQRDPSDTQQAQQGYRDDSGVTGGTGQWTDPSSQGQDTTMSGDQYEQQARYGQAGQQRSDDWGQGRAGAGRTSDPSSTSAQYGGTGGQTGGYQDPSTGGNWQGDDDTTGTGTGGGKPSAMSKVKGTAEKMAGKMTGDSGKQARGDERREGLY